MLSWIKIIFCFYFTCCTNLEALVHTANWWKKLMKQNKQIFLSILFISRPNTIWLTIVFWIDLMISPHILQNGFILNHMSIFFKNQSFAYQFWIEYNLMALKMLFPHTTICYNNICKDFFINLKEIQVCWSEAIKGDRCYQKILSPNLRQ